MRAKNLKTEYLKDPIGIDILRPRFFWNCDGGTSQSAYRIRCIRDGHTVWDSGRVESPQMTHIRYSGEELHSRDRVKWMVRLWDENGREGAESEAGFEMGLLESGDWTAKWISGAYRVEKKRRHPADCFRKKFSLRGDVRSARLYASARGIYTVSVNGQEIRDFLFAPGMTDYRKRIQYQTYDVTGLLEENNILTLMLGDGWYLGSCAAYGVREVYGNRTSLIAQLEIQYKDGTSETIGTDNDWEWSDDGPVRFNDLKDGEVYDARRRASYAGKAVKCVPPGAPLTASNNVPVTAHEEFSGKEIMSGIYDFGQNIAGIIRFSVRGAKGDSFILRCGEILGDNGHVELGNMQEKRPAGGWSQGALLIKLMTGRVIGATEMTPLQEIRFTCSGGRDTYEMHFSVFGFRYVELITQAALALEDLTALAVYSDYEETGSFRCSHEGLNRLVEAARWSMKSNFLELPTDCPTRERLGWTGDAQIFFNTAAYFGDVAAFFRKWIYDMQDAQYQNGLLPAVLPYQGVEMMYKNTGSSAGWADAVYLVPWRYYLRYGDREILEECWSMIWSYAEYLLKNQEKDGSFCKGVQLGEWLEPLEFRDKGPKEKHPEEATAYFFLAMHTIARIASLLEKNEEAEVLRNAAGRAKDVYRRKLFDTDAVRPSKLVRPVAFGLLTDEECKAAVSRLNQVVRDFGYRVGTGFLSTPFLLTVLARNGYIPTAYSILENTENPGWLFEIEHGATTIWETWEGTTVGEQNSGSLNHYSPGAVCEFLFSSVAGIQCAGERRFIIEPLPDQSLTSVEAAYQSLYGEVKVGWERRSDSICFSVIIPGNCTAKLKLPDKTEMELQAGFSRATYRLWEQN